MNESMKGHYLVLDNALNRKSKPMTCKNQDESYSVMHLPLYSSVPNIIGQI